MPPERFEPARLLIEEAIAARAFPAAVMEVGRAEGVLWGAALGRLTYYADAATVGEDTIFDLASLTKVIATTTLAMRLVDAGRLTLDGLVAQHLPEWRGGDRDGVRVRDLLAHSSGLTAYLPYFRDHSGRREFEHSICTMPLEYPPGTRSLYSDLGFMLLGFIIEDVGGATLAAQFEPVAATIAPEPMAFTPPKSWRARTAPTEVDSWRGRLMIGEVHDENCWALGGVAGHAGLFGTAAAVGAFARLMLQTLDRSASTASDQARALADTASATRFVQRVAVPGSSRALGWDTMLPTSSCGTRMSASAIGHTGFTGTSLWIDPARDVYVVLLTNRVHPTRENQLILKVRPAFHDLVMTELGY